MSSATPSDALDTPTGRRAAAFFQDALIGLLTRQAPLVRERMREVLKASSSTMDITRVSYWSVRGALESIRCECLYRKDGDCFEEGLVLEARQYPRYFEALRQGNTVAAEDAMTDARTSEFAEGYLRPAGIGAMLDVPIYVRGALVGVVCHEHVGGRRRWSDVELNFAMSVAQLFSLGIEAGAREQAEVSLTRRNGLLKAILDSMSEGVVVADLSGRLVEINPSAAAMIGPELATLPADAWAPPMGIFAQDDGPPLAATDQPLARAVRGESVDLTRLFLRTPIHPQGIWISASASPLRDGDGRARGGVMVFRDVTELKRTQDLVEKQAHALQTLSMLDELTGLYNRRGFLTLAEQYRRSSRREQKPLSLFFLDMDGLKAVNDGLGHAAGDLALRESAEVLKLAFRESDIIARMGGDEFAVLAVNAEDGERLALRIRERIDEINRRPGRAFRLSLSIGWVTIPPGDAKPLDAYLTAADERMYAEKRGKNSGRGR